MEGLHFLAGEDVLREEGDIVSAEGLPCDVKRLFRKLREDFGEDCHEQFLEIDRCFLEG